MRKQVRVNKLTICYRKKTNWVQFFKSLSCYWKNVLLHWIRSHFDDDMTKLMINNRTDAWKTESLECALWIRSLISTRCFHMISVSGVLAWKRTGKYAFSNKNPIVWTGEYKTKRLVWVIVLPSGWPENRYFKKKSISVVGVYNAQKRWYVTRKLNNGHLGMRRTFLVFGSLRFSCIRKSDMVSFLNAFILNSIVKNERFCVDGRRKHINNNLKRISSVDKV